MFMLVVPAILTRNKGVGKRFSRGEGRGNGKKDRKLATLFSLFRGEGGNEKKDRKIAKKPEK